MTLLLFLFLFLDLVFLFGGLDVRWGSKGEVAAICLLLRFPPFQCSTGKKKKEKEISRSHGVFRHERKAEECRTALLYSIHFYDSHMESLTAPFLQSGTLTLTPIHTLPLTVEDSSLHLLLFVFLTSSSSRGETSHPPFADSSTLELRPWWVLPHATSHVHQGSIYRSGRDPSERKA